MRAKGWGWIVCHWKCRIGRQAAGSFVLLFIPHQVPNGHVPFFSLYCLVFSNFLHPTSPHSILHLFARFLRECRSFKPQIKFLMKLYKSSTQMQCNIDRCCASSEQEIAPESFLGSYAICNKINYL